MTTGLYEEDSSLQGFGRRLSRFAPAVDEQHRTARAEVNNVRELANVYRKAANQIDSDLPGSKRLAAALEEQAKKAERAAQLGEEMAELLHGLGGEASGLPGLYRGEHEHDEYRNEAPRNGLAAEMRADVRAAQQDT